METKQKKQIITLKRNDMYTEQVQLRISKEDKEFLQAQADKNRLTLSSYVRTKVFSK